MIRMFLAAASAPTAAEFNNDSYDHSGSEMIRTEARLLAIRPLYVAIPFADLKAVTRRPQCLGNWEFLPSRLLTALQRGRRRSGRCYRIRRPSVGGYGGRTVAGMQDVQ
jgi:hypothetical protein